MEGSVPHRVVIKDPDAPVTCPPQFARWNLHPRVYLTRKPGDREVMCPYCGTRYVLPDAAEAGQAGAKQS